MAEFRGAASEINRLMAEVRELEKEAVQEVKNAARVVVDELMRGTPVWEGETVRNYGVSVGGNSPSYRDALGTGDPGPTNSMSLGEEPRRGINEDAAKADVERSLAGFRKLGSRIAVVNTVGDTKWDLIDSGSAPTPDMARYPGGVEILATQRAKGRLRNFS